MKISSLAELRELFKLLVEQDIERFELGDLKVSRKSRALGMVIPLPGDSEYSEPGSEAAETADEDLLYYSAGGN